MVLTDDITVTRPEFVRNNNYGALYGLLTINNASFGSRRIFAEHFGCDNLLEIEKYRQTTINFREFFV